MVPSPPSVGGLVVVLQRRLRSTKSFVYPVQKTQLLLLLYRLSAVQELGLADTRHQIMPSPPFHLLKQQERERGALSILELNSTNVMAIQLQVGFCGFVVMQPD